MLTKFLKSPNWLNDEIINAFGVLLNSQYPKIYCFLSFFYGDYLKYGYNRVKNYLPNKVCLISTCSAYLLKVSDYTKLFVPVNIADSHWVLGVINLRFRRVECYDSMGGTQRTMGEVCSRLRSSLSQRTEAPRLYCRAHTR